MKRGEKPKMLGERSKRPMLPERKLRTVQPMRGISRRMKMKILTSMDYPMRRIRRSCWKEGVV